MAAAAVPVVDTSQSPLPVIHRLELQSRDGSSFNHSIVSISPQMHDTFSTTSRGANFYNIAMFDVSGSMGSVWPSVMAGWNDLVAPALTGVTDIYTFGTYVTLRRRGVHLEDSDNDQSMTNLTQALHVISDKVHSCTHRNVRIFLVTDGRNNCGADPKVEIEKMSIPKDKTVEVYLLGVGLDFPVEYSVDIRSRFHNGSASCPTLFWSKDPNEVADMLSEMAHIEDEVQKGVNKFTLSIPARSVPLVDEMKSICSSGEFLFYETDPVQLQQELIIWYEDDVQLPISTEIVTASAKFLVSNLFKQWNSVLIQMHRKKMAVPMEVFDIMQQLFDIQMKYFMEIENQSLKSRLSTKHARTLRLEFSNLMNQSRNMINLEVKFQKESDLAEAILKTTVQSRYDTKLLKIKGHLNTDWDEDIEAFKKQYLDIVDEIKAVPAPDPDDCCRILLCSFLSDLQDPDFLEVLKENKMDFLTSMTFTGIPILAPVKDSSQINPWTLYIENICVSPFEIISQRAMESSFAVGASDARSTNKEVTLQQDNPMSVFNVIVPIIPKEHCQLLKRLVRTNVFAVGATFCILKNALIIDHNCHFAALGCVWMKTIKDHRLWTRPDYIKKRIIDIEETAKLYLDRKGYSDYISGLLTKPKLALMTEANEEHNGTTLKCESMVKPAFMLHLAKDKITSQESQVTLMELLQMILVEFLGRCLSSNTSATPYMDYLLPDFAADRRTQWLNGITERVLERINLTGDLLLESYYSPEDVTRHTRDSVMATVNEVLAEGSELSLEPSPNMYSVVRLRNSGSAGHVGWEDLRAWALEMAGAPPSGEQQGAGAAAGGVVAQGAGAVALLTQDSIDTAFSTDMVCSYLHHALQHRQSRERLATPVVGFQEAREVIIAKLKAEQDYFLKTNLLPAVEKAAIDKWRESYLRVHRELARPLTRQQIVQQAVARGVSVTEQTFDQIYKYRESVHLCRNCCHVASCPHYLIPNRSFNCHLEVERQDPNYPHTLHLVVSQHRNSAAQAVDLVRSGTETGTRNRRKLDKLPDTAEDALRQYITDLDKEYDSMGV